MVRRRRFLPTCAYMLAFEFREVFAIFVSGRNIRRTVSDDSVLAGSLPTRLHLLKIECGKKKSSHYFLLFGIAC